MTRIIARGHEAVLPVNDTPPKLRSADAGKLGMTLRKLVDISLGAWAPVLLGRTRMKLTVLVRVGAAALLVGKVAAQNGTLLPHNHTSCQDDPDGVLTAFGGCATGVTLGCDTDLNTVNPAAAPVGTLVSLLCPASCGKCESPSPSPPAVLCQDDPDGVLTAFGGCDEGHRLPSPSGRGGFKLEM